jgi:hypothetical protein
MQPGQIAVHLGQGILRRGRALGSAQGREKLRRSLQRWLEPSDPEPGQTTLHPIEQTADDGCVAALAGGYFERDGTTATIDNSMDFCRSPAARAADRLELGPPFPPAAERCALAVVLSII